MAQSRPPTGNLPLQAELDAMNILHLPETRAPYISMHATLGQVLPIGCSGSNSIGHSRKYLLLALASKTSSSEILPVSVFIEMNSEVSWVSIPSVLSCEMVIELQGPSPEGIS